MPHFVTSAQAEPHVTSSNDARLMAGIYGNGSYVLPICNKLAATMVNSNTIRILNGDALTCGRHWSIDDAYEEYSIENGTPGMKRIDLITARIKTSPTETIEIVIHKGEEVASNPATPSYVSGDLNDGDTVTEMPLYTVLIDGINPGEPVAQFRVPDAMMEFCDSLSQRIAYEDVKLTLDLASDHNSVGQPNLHLLACSNVNEDNFIAKMLISFWPRSTWDNASVTMCERYSTGMYWNRCWFTTTKAQTYDLWIRLLYWV